MIIPSFSFMKDALSMCNLFKSFHDKQKRRKEVISFLHKWLESEQEIFVFLNQNLNLFEKELGSYKFEKLFTTLSHIKICSFKRTYGGKYLCNVNATIPACDADYIQGLIGDVKKGNFDNFLN